MQFNVEEDNGTITMWICPSNPIAAPNVSVTIGSEAPVVVSANTTRADLRSYGLHATGECGFLLSNEVVPGIQASRLVSVRDLDTDLLIYKRDLDHEYLDGRLFRLETSVAHHRQIDLALGSRFHMAYAGLENVSGETAKSVLRIPYAVSVYASGRLPLGAIDDVLRRQGFKVALLVRDPATELLERLHMLASPDEHAEILSSLMPASVLERVTPHFAGLDMRRLDKLGQAIEGLDNEAIAYLSDPLTRQLIEIGHGEPLPRDAAQQAVLRLAEVDIVSNENDAGGFFETASAVMQASPPFVGPMPGPPGHLGVESVLRRQPWCARLVRHDTAVFQAFTEAEATVSADAAAFAS